MLYPTTLLWLLLLFSIIRFQELIALPDTESKYRQLAYLAHDFQHAAEVYGRIIISERFEPEANKTIKPLKIGNLTSPLCNLLLKFCLMCI